MHKVLTALVGAVGMGMVVGGVCGLMGALNTHEVINANLGPFSGRYTQHDLRFISVMVAAVGGALFTFALLIRRP